MAKFYCFLWLAEYYSIVSVYIYLSLSHIFFIHSSVEYLGCFHILAIINNTAMNIGLHVSLWIGVFTFFRCIPSGGIAESDHSSINIFNFLRNTVFAPIYIPTYSVWGFPILTCSTMFIVLFWKHKYVVFVYLWLFWAFAAVCGLSLGGATGGSSPVAVLGMLVSVTSLVVD